MHVCTFLGKDAHEKYNHVNVVSMQSMLKTMKIYNIRKSNKKLISREKV